MRVPNEIVSRAISAVNRIEVAGSPLELVLLKYGAKGMILCLPNARRVLLETTNIVRADDRVAPIIPATTKLFQRPISRIIDVLPINSPAAALRLKRKASSI